MLKNDDGNDMSVMDYLSSYKCQFTHDLVCGDALPLVDKLTPPGDSTVTRGRREMALIADGLEYAIHQLPILEWHSIKDGLPPRPNTPYHLYLVANIGSPQTTTYGEPALPQTLLWRTGYGFLMKTRMYGYSSGRIRSMSLGF